MSERDDKILLLQRLLSEVALKFSLLIIIIIKKTIIMIIIHVNNDTIRSQCSVCSAWLVSCSRPESINTHEQLI